MPEKRILLVDDEEELLKGMKIRLTSWGYGVITATCGEEAIRIAKESKGFLDAIVLDVMMPEMDGIETLRQIKNFDKKIPIFMLTAYTSDETVKKTTDLGIAGFIPKGSAFTGASSMLRTAIKGAKKAVRKKPERKELI